MLEYEGRRIEDHRGNLSRIVHAVWKVQIITGGPAACECSPNGSSRAWKRTGEAPDCPGCLKVVATEEKEARLNKAAPALYEATRDYLEALDQYKPVGVVNDAIDRMRAAVKDADQ